MVVSRAWCRLIVFAVGFASGPATGAETATALAPSEIYAEGFGDIRGLVVDAAGNVYVADRAHGTVTRIAPDLARRVIASGLERPIGLALDQNGGVLIAEERAGRIVRIAADGARTAVVTGVKQPRWLAVGDDGTLYIAARRLTRDTDPEPDDESAEPEVILRLTPEGALTILADGFRRLQGLAFGGRAVFAATQGHRDGHGADGMLMRIPLLDAGAAGAPAAFGPSDQFKKPIGLARDRLGPLLFTTKELTADGDRARRAVAKLQPDGQVSLFAQGLDTPSGLAVAPSGDLFVADGNAGRVLRFRAPAPPSLQTPAVTSQTLTSATGTSDPGARIDVFVNDALEAAVISDSAGRFGVSLTLAPDTLNALDVFATAHRGDGLASSPARAQVLHDGVAPVIALQEPATSHVRSVVTVRGTAADHGQVAAIALTAAGRPLPGTTTPSLPASLVAADATWDTQTVADGAHPVAATAADRAGNVASVSRTVIVDNSPPDTHITAGPGVGTVDRSPRFTFSGSDDLTPPTGLRFSWRLDDGPWSPFTSDPTTTLAGLTDGVHRFEVKALDVAGNEDPSPAARQFIVAATTKPLRITEPVAGAAVPIGDLLVQGSLDIPDPSAVILVNDFPAAVHAGRFAVVVPVNLATGSVTAVARSAAGDISDVVPITVAPTVTSAPTLRVVPASGLAPLAVALHVTGAAPGSVVEFDLESDGNAELTAVTDTARLTYQQPGVHVATVRLIDTAGVSTTMRAVVHVYDSARLDQALQTQWSGLKRALGASDIPGALDFVAVGARTRYREIFTDVAPDLPDVDAILTDFVLVDAWGGQAVGAMVRMDDGQAVAFEVRFRLEDDGVWRVASF